jgi:ABC-type maltose transport system permease subunit
MNTKLAFKAYVTFFGSFLFWGLYAMTFIVYSFMPKSKDFNQLVFTIAFPLLYLFSYNYILTKLFKESGYKVWLVNTVIIILVSLLSLGVLNIVMKFFGF